MRRLPALIAALLLPAAQPLLLGTAVSTATLLVSQEQAHSQSAEAVAKIAQAITVRIEGATQGSGVLVKREGNRYTVLTAWHVVSGQRPGEELDIYTPDGQRHQLEQGSIKHLGDVDMAVLSFSNPNSYEVARSGDVKSVSMGSPIFVGGFPLPSSAVPTRLLRFLKGDVIANATVAIPNGYQLLYSNQTLPGMSGGAVMNAQGQLVGIHGQGETDSKMSEQQGVAVKTGTNQAVPIAYYSQYSAGAAVVASSAQAETADDFLVQAVALQGSKGKEREIIKLVGLSLAARPSAEAYFISANAKTDLGENASAIADYSKAIELNPKYIAAWRGRGLARLGVDAGWQSDFDKSKSLAESIQPITAKEFLERANTLFYNRKKDLALSDLNQALSLSPQFVDALLFRSTVKLALYDKSGALADAQIALALQPSSPRALEAVGLALLQSGNSSACSYLKRADLLSNAKPADWSYYSHYCLR